MKLYPATLAILAIFAVAANGEQGLRAASKTPSSLEDGQSDRRLFFANSFNHHAQAIAAAMAALQAEMLAAMQEEIQNVLGQFISPLTGTFATALGTAIDPQYFYYLPLSLTVPTLTEIDGCSMNANLTLRMGELAGMSTIVLSNVTVVAEPTFDSDVDSLTVFWTGGNYELNATISSLIVDAILRVQSNDCGQDVDETVEGDLTMTGLTAIINIDLDGKTSSSGINQITDYNVKTFDFGLDEATVSGLTSVDLGGVFGVVDVSEAIETLLDDETKSFVSPAASWALNAAKDSVGLPIEMEYLVF